MLRLDNRSSYYHSIISEYDKGAPTEMPHNGNRRRVWILGAGFSYPLGAPLFADLFGDAYASLARGIRNRFNDHLTIHKVYRNFFRSVAIDVYSQGIARNFWYDPEQFLQRATDSLHARDDGHFLWEWLFNVCTEFRNPKDSTAGSTKLLRERVSQAIEARSPDLVAGMIDAAREEVAVEVSIFLFGARFETEKWGPYRHWLDSLTGYDSIISFNYDQAIEQLRERTDYPNALNCPKPNRIIEDRRYPTLFKLHGSAGWKIKKPGTQENNSDGSVSVIEDCEKILDFLDDYSYRPCIYTPGPEKMDFANKWPIWEHAMSRIRSAEEIHVIGYRFPETDSFAQQEIVSALADNSHCTAVNIVLGPDIGKPEVRRVRRIISATGKRPRALEVYTQDYLKPAVDGRDFGED